MRSVCGFSHLIGVVPVVEGDWEPPAGRCLPQNHICNGLAALHNDVHMSLVPTALQWSHRHASLQCLK